MSCSVLKCVAVCCSASQCVALCCGVVQRVAVCCSARGESEGQASSTVKPAIAAIWKSVYFGICIWIVHVTFKCVITLTNDFEKWRFRKKIGLLTRHASFHDSCKSHFFFSHTCERGMSHMNELWHICKTGGEIGFLTSLVKTCVPPRSREALVACFSSLCVPWLVCKCAATHSHVKCLFHAWIRADQSSWSSCYVWIKCICKWICGGTHLYMCQDSFACEMPCSCVNTCIPHRACEARVACESSVYVSYYVSLHVPWLIYICATTHSHVTCLYHAWIRAQHIDLVKLL